MKHTVQEYRNLLSHISAGPWRVETLANQQITGDNWLIADFGDNTNFETTCVTTDHVHASELGEPEADAEFLITMRNEFPGALDELERAQAEEQILLHALRQMIGKYCNTGKAGYYNANAPATINALQTLISRGELERVKESNGLLIAKEVGRNEV